MQQVSEWLEKLGLGQYAQRFAENDISFSVLPDLTDQHLKEIGVSLEASRRECAVLTFLPDRKWRPRHHSPLPVAFMASRHLGIVSSLSTPSPRYVPVQVPMRRRAATRRSATPMKKVPGVHRRLPVSCQQRDLLQALSN
jgi:hypothetical protein